MIKSTWNCNLFPQAMSCARRRKAGIITSGKTTIVNQSRVDSLVWPVSKVKLLLTVMHEYKINKIQNNKFDKMSRNSSQLKADIPTVFCKEMNSNEKKAAAVELSHAKLMQSNCCDTISHQVQKTRLKTWLKKGAEWVTTRQWIQVVLCVWAMIFQCN